MSLTYGLLLVFAFLVGFAGNLFSVGIAWNAAWFSRRNQGFALGVFGAGNVGASLTKFIGPAIITATAGSVYLGGLSPRRLALHPRVYAFLLVGMAALVFFVAPQHDRRPGSDRPLGEMFRPLKYMRVWRFSLYYVVVFGAYVALASALPKYYVDDYGVELQAGRRCSPRCSSSRPRCCAPGRLALRQDRRTPAHVLHVRPDAGRAALPVAPFGYIVLRDPDRHRSEVLPYSLGIGRSPSWCSCVGFAHGHRQGRGLQAHPRVLPARCRRCRRAGGDARRPRRLLPAAPLRCRRDWTGMPRPPSWSSSSSP